MKRSDTQPGPATAGAVERRVRIRTGPEPRVLLLGHVLDQGRSGVGRWAEQMLPRLAAELAARGGRLAVTTPPGATSSLVPDGADAIELDVPSGPPFVRWQREGPAVRRCLDAARAAGRPFDWVHTAHLPLPRRLPRDLVRVSWLVHDLRQLTASLVGTGRRLIAPTLYRAAARRADLVCTVSEHVAELLRERFGSHLADGAPLVVHNGADHLPLHPRSDRADDGFGPFLLGIGHLERRKNVAVVLDALALEPTLPDLVWIGRGPERARLERLARELGVAQRVTFLDGADDEDLARSYSRAACVVLPSLLEGFGLVAAEALRAGVPLVHARAGALPEVAGGHGYPFEATDPHDLVRTLSDALDCGAPEAGRTHAARFTWDRAARALADAWCRA
ncbi:D-inositol 3-phosphate glycosyltransferase [Planctomycetes bacterium Pla163]|uniref:D-inositol 3-phosphate glycosyltransferase n=1 Tax=Rohdeia mirabilis TaxID=2528008 RepID=A0A518D2A5_9BACT|nr:D-inositol 3-phosphate glycosyltransferase [Planctomycetes bacterium Pla163]